MDDPIAGETQAGATVAFEIALEEYFKLKGKYEASLRKQMDEYRRKSIEVGIQLTNKQLYNTVKTQIRCISCNRAVGTIFMMKDRTYIAKCGDPAAPCSLDIRIKRMEAGNADTIREQLLADIREIEEKVIQLKMDLLFQYITEDAMISQFYEMRKEHQQFSDVAGQLTAQLIERDTDKETALVKSEKEFLELIETVQARMSEYLATNNTALLKEIISLYTEELMPLADEIRSTKYDHVRVELLDRSGEVMSSGFREQDKKKEIELVLVRATNTLELNEIVSDEASVLAFKTERKARKPRATGQRKPRAKKTSNVVAVDDADDADGTDMLAAALSQGAAQAPQSAVVAPPADEIEAEEEAVEEEAVEEEAVEEDGDGDGGASAQATPVAQATPSDQSVRSVESVESVESAESVAEDEQVGGIRQKLIIY